MITSKDASHQIPIVALLNRLLSRLLQGLVRLYQLTLSPFIGNQCRFHPTCSRYAMEALERHGPWRGSWLAATRLCRCHPFAEGGFDAVPDSNPTLETSTGRNRACAHAPVEEAL